MRTRHQNKRRLITGPPRQNTGRYNKVPRVGQAMGINDLTRGQNQPCTSNFNDFANDDYINLEPTTSSFDNDNDDDVVLILDDSNDTVNVIQSEKMNKENFEQSQHDIQEEQHRNQDADNGNSDAKTNETITLDTVWQGINSLQSTMSNISNSLQSVSTRINSLDPRINNLETTIGNVKTQTSTFDQVKAEVTGLREELRQVTNELNTIKQNNPPQESVSISKIISEMRERDIKSRNLIIYNVPEDNLSISEDYSTLDDINQFNALIASRDTSRARRILEVIPDIDLDDISTRRIGRFNSNRCRPLIVVLSCNDDIITVFRNRHLIDQKYNVKTDLTKLQQNNLKELREELEKINATSVQKMTIKYVNGEPKIVPDRRQFPKRE